MKLNNCQTPDLNLTYQSNYFFWMALYSDGCLGNRLYAEILQTRPDHTRPDQTNTDQTSVAERWELGSTTNFVCSPPPLISYNFSKTVNLNIVRLPT